MTPRSTKASRIYCGQYPLTTPPLWFASKSNERSDHVSLRFSESSEETCQSRELAFATASKKFGKGRRSASNWSREGRREPVPTAYCQASVVVVERIHPKTEAINGRPCQFNASKVISPNSTRRLGISASFAFRNLLQSRKTFLVRSASSPSVQIEPIDRGDRYLKSGMNALKLIPLALRTVTEESFPDPPVIGLIHSDQAPQAIPSP